MRKFGIYIELLYLCIVITNGLQCKDKKATQMYENEKQNQLPDSGAVDQLHCLPGGHPGRQRCPGTGRTRTVRLLAPSHADHRHLLLPVVPHGPADITRPGPASTIENKAAPHSRTIPTRAASQPGRPFSFRPFNRPQTEP